jgi:serine/threonine protein kinase
MQQSPETTRGIEYFRNIVESGKALKLLEANPVNQGHSFLMVVSGYEKKWYFSISRDRLNDLPATKAHHPSALGLARALEGRFKNISPNYFVTQSGRLVEIDIEWPSLPLARPTGYTDVSWVNIKDLSTREVAKCPVEFNFLQGLNSDVLTPYTRPEYITNSVRAGIDNGTVKFRHLTDERPREYSSISIQFGEFSNEPVSVQAYLARKVWLLAFKAGNGHKGNKTWIADPWDARYLGCSESELRQAAAVLDAQGKIVLDSDAEFASVGNALLASDGLRIERKDPVQKTTPPKSPFRTPFHVYTERGVIGEGGSGRVLRVVDEDGVEHALKYLKPDTASVQKSKRFRNELNFSANNTHQNIIKVTDRGLAEIEGTEVPFYVMPVYRQTLRALMDGSVGSEKLMSIFLQILNGVEEAHNRQIWHRDLKPENILFDSASDTAVVTDFGIAHFSEEHLHTEIMTRPQDRLANFRYAAPEQRSNSIADGRADIYALGMILYEMLTGELLQGSQLKKVASVHPGLTHLDYLVERMTTQSPDDRLATITDVKRQLGRHTATSPDRNSDAETGLASPYKKLAPVAYARYETTGPNAVKAESYVRPSEEYPGAFIYEDSFGENRLESEELAAQSFLTTDRKLTHSGYIRMNYANLSGKNLFDL